MLLQALIIPTRRWDGRECGEMRCSTAVWRIVTAAVVSKEGRLCY